MSAKSIQEQTEHWSSQLRGKVVVPDPDSPKNTFAHANLPVAKRICPPGTLMTRDFCEDRLNVHTNEEGEVSHVTMG